MKRIILFFCICCLFCSAAIAAPRNQRPPGHGKPPVAPRNPRPAERGKPHVAPRNQNPVGHGKPHAAPKNQKPIGHEKPHAAPKNQKSSDHGKEKLRAHARYRAAQVQEGFVIAFGGDHEAVAAVRAEAGAEWDKETGNTGKGAKRRAVEAEYWRDRKEAERAEKEKIRNEAKEHRMKKEEKRKASHDNKGNKNRKRR